MFKLKKYHIENETVLVSILIPVFNREEYIEKCLEHIINQTYRNIEILIYNDGCTDGTISKIPKDCRIRIINSNSNKGVAHARNVLLSEAKGYYSMWQDSDDFCSKNRIYETLKYISHLNKSNVFFDMVFSNIIFFKNNQNPTRRGARVYKPNIKQHPFEKGLNGNNITFGTGFFVTTTCKKVFFDIKKTKGGSDLDWLKRLSVRFCYMDKTLYYCRRHEGRLSFKKRFDKLKKEGRDPYKNKWIQSHINK